MREDILRLAPERSAVRHDLESVRHVEPHASLDHVLRVEQGDLRGSVMAVEVGRADLAPLRHILESTGVATDRMVFNEPKIDDRGRVGQRRYELRTYPCAGDEALVHLGVGVVVDRDLDAGRNVLLRDASRRKVAVPLLENGDVLWPDASLDHRI